MMTDSRIRLGLVILLFFLLGRGVFLRPESERSSSATVFAGGIAIAGSPPLLVFTCSEDGKTLYRWQCDPRALRKEPKYLGKTEAILVE